MSESPLTEGETRVKQGTLGELVIVEKLLHAILFLLFVYKVFKNKLTIGKKESYLWFNVDSVNHTINVNNFSSDQADTFHLKIVF